MAKSRILVVDDTPEVLQSCRTALRKIPESVVILEQDSRAALDLLSKERFDLLLTDLHMPDVDGRELLQAAHRHDPDLRVVVMTGFPTVETAIECLKLGAIDYVIKPIDTTEFLSTVRRLLDERRLKQENSLMMRQIERPYSFRELVGKSSAMVAVREMVERVAAADVDVLITGETGVGKELVARSIHQQSARKGGHFVPVDCSAIPESLLESELFGHERGAFTGADRDKMGLVEFADKGTLFLDEIGELPLQLQPKFLRTLQERTFRRVGGRDEISVDLRVVAATNRDLVALIQERRFREELYYRIKVARIDVPPLRERAADVPLLVEHLVRRHLAECGKTNVEVDPECVEQLARYSWPGNVRELQNVLKCSLTMARSPRIEVDDLPDEIVSATQGPSSVDTGGFFAAREQQLARFERTYFETLLRAHGGDVTRAAQEAKLPRGTLYRLLKKQGLTPDDYR